LKRDSSKVKERPLLGVMNIQFPLAFIMILNFHLRNGDSILDPTYGKGLSWEEYERNQKLKNSMLWTPKTYDIITKYNLEQCVDLSKKFEAIFFDPPYIFDIQKTDDGREENYGEYHHALEDIEQLFQLANITFPSLLIPNGKLFLKYTDVFSMKARKFFFCTMQWINIMKNFKVIDHYIIQHHHISPTAYQVKNRPCGIVNYTCLTVLQKESI